MRTLIKVTMLLFNQALPSSVTSCQNFSAYFA